LVIEELKEILVFIMSWVYIGNIKMKLFIFKKKMIQKLTWNERKKMELIFDYHNYLEERKIKLVVIEFTNYNIIW
jgi:hypothetical protein